jgi:hypothetical protein
METRALIIAVEHYPESKSTSTCLEGTIASAEKVARWLENELQVPRERILFCSSGDSVYRTHGATRAEIRKAVIRIIKEGGNATDRLLIFLSGHGVMKPGKPGKLHSDILLSSDFVASDLSGDACIQVDELTVLLARSLGAGSHVCFIDACRTVDDNLQPIGLGLYPPTGVSGVAGWYQLLSATSGGYAVSDSQFVDLLIKCLDGGCDLDYDIPDNGDRWVTFRSVAKAIEKEFEQIQRGIEVRTAAKSLDYRIRSMKTSGQVLSVVGPLGKKSPPVEFLAAYDVVTFLGDTNSQLPPMLSKAFEARGKRRWKRLDVLSVEDLSTNGRPGVSVGALNKERDDAEAEFMQLAADYCDAMALYRYRYAGFYGSFWTAGDGRRRAHVSALIPGLDIRMTQSADFVDFPNERQPTVDFYFNQAQATIARSDTKCIFQYPPDLPRD